jgi:Kef-type K+ transport system membrane component KefB
MSWYPFLGYGAFWIGLIVAIILYAMKRKWYPIMYLISICLYVFTVGFAIDVFNLSKNAILLLLAFSAALMIGLGFYLSNKFGENNPPLKKR